MTATNEPPTTGSDEQPTLDPPGSIAVIGAGPLGIEAALYGRFLGYDVAIFEAIAVAASFRDHGEEPLPMLPDRSLSPLAVSALAAQSSDTTRALPMTFDQWIGSGWEPLLETDLLSGRLKCPARVIRMETVDVADAEEDIPPDFRLTIEDVYGQTDARDFEAVILATGPRHGIDFTFDFPVDYLMSIGADFDNQPLSETTFLSGLKQIVTAYAGLTGRSDLDLYRPRPHPR